MVPPERWAANQFTSPRGASLLLYPLDAPAGVGFHAPAASADIIQDTSAGEIDWSQRTIIRASAMAASDTIKDPIG